MHLYLGASMLRRMTGSPILQCLHFKAMALVQKRVINKAVARVFYAEAHTRPQGCVSDVRFSAFSGCSLPFVKESRATAGHQAFALKVDPVFLTFPASLRGKE